MPIGRDRRIDDVLEHCETTEAKQKFYSNVVEAKELIEHNYNMMQLSSPNIPAQSLPEIRSAINEMDMSFNKTEVVTMMIKDGFGAGNWDSLYSLMKKFSVEG